MNEQTYIEMKTATETLCKAMAHYTCSPPVTNVYNPLTYAKDAYYQYLQKYGSSEKRVVFLGMNPGPWGMAQTGIPFGEVSYVRDWLNIDGAIHKPAVEHPKRPISGYDCTRSEVSGRRLWGLFSELFESPDAFFTHHFVANYCPLVFMEESGRNRTPDKLSSNARAAIFEGCDRYLVRTVEILKPRVLIGVGKFAMKRAQKAVEQMDESMRPSVAAILHPSPASPMANRGWSTQAI